jgi:membrane protein YdbS with pleckstrin-like domain
MCLSKRTLILTQFSRTDAPVLSAPVEAAPDEQVFFHGHPSWRSMIRFHLKGLVWAIVAGVLAGLASAAAGGAVSVTWVVVAVLAVFVAVIVTGLVRRRRITYTITSQRLTIQLGLMARELHETRLDRIQNVNSRQSMLERLLHIGTVDFDTAGGAGYEFRFDGVAHPHTIVRTVNRALGVGAPGPELGTGSAAEPTLRLPPG